MIQLIVSSLLLGRLIQRQNKHSFDMIKHLILLFFFLTIDWILIIHYKVLI